MLITHIELFSATDVSMEENSPSNASRALQMSHDDSPKKFSFFKVFDHSDFEYSQQLLRKSSHLCRASFRNDAARVKISSYFTFCRFSTVEISNIDICLSQTAPISIPRALQTTHHIALKQFFAQFSTMEISKIYNCRSQGAHISIARALQTTHHIALKRFFAQFSTIEISKIDNCRSEGATSLSRALYKPRITLH